MNDQNTKILSWLEDNFLNPIEIDCITAVMLKILDGKCKMSEQEKEVMVCLYDAIHGQPGELLGAGIHDLIKEARQDLNDVMRDRVYEQRIFAETMIARPRMKSFKARLRETGILEK